MSFLLDKLTGLLAFAFVLGVTIFWHEFGHFITAKAYRMRVFVFSFGFGRRLFGFQWGDTDCRVSLIPLGGYVKLEGEADDKISEDTSQAGDGRDFTARPRWQRILVYLAGPAMNVVLTVVVLTGVLVYGAHLLDLSDAPIIGNVDPGSPADKAGLQSGDEILAIGNEATKTWEKVLEQVFVRPNQRLRLRVRRGAEEREATVETTASGAGGHGYLGAQPLVLISTVTADSPAHKAGVQPGDVVLKVGGEPVYKFEDIKAAVGTAGDKPITLEVSRSRNAGTGATAGDRHTQTLQVTPQGGLIGITGGPRTVYRKYGPLRAFRESCSLTAHMAGQTFSMLKQLLTASISPRTTLQGPVQIYMITKEAAKSGFVDLFLLIAQISISVGILNLFPLPPLDGGHLAILYIEAIRRRDLSLQAKTWIINAGAIAVLLLIATVLYFDLSKTPLFQKLFNN